MKKWIVVGALSAFSLSSCASAATGSRNCPVGQVQFVGVERQPGSGVPIGEFLVSNNGSEVFRVPLAEEGASILHPAHGKIFVRSTGSDWRAWSPTLEDTIAADETLDVQARSSKAIFFDGAGLFTYSQGKQGEEYQLVITDIQRRCKLESLPFTLVP